MKPKQAIVFVGMPGAGKTVCVEHLKAKGLASVYFGGITIDEIKKRGLEVNEANEKVVREDIRAKEGKGAYALRIITQVERYFEQDKQYVVVDGLYSWTEYKIFKETLEDNAIIVAVISPRGIRHQRLAQRKIRPLTKEEADSRDYAEIENLEKGGPIANADHYLYNDAGREAMLQDLDKLLAELAIEL